MCNRPALLAAALLVPAFLCWGQTGAGNIQGTVKDISSAVVPQARVTIVHTETSRQYTTETNQVGFYLFPSIPVGAYRISAAYSGMETWSGELTLAAGQSAVVEPVLVPAGTATAVTVAGDVTPLVTTTSPTVASTLEHARIEQLPLNGRNVTTLIYMTTPGVETGSVPRNYGLRYATELVQDGAVLSNREFGALPARPPGLDTIGEFRAETANSSAKMNRPGTFILTTRSGTNELHGSVFETARNSGVGVARARTDYYDKPPHLVRNEFGGSLGGPVFIPKLYNGKNKTFFFFAYEGYRLRQSSTRRTAVPTAAMREGDFSGLIDAQGRKYAIYDPWSTDSKTWLRTPFPNNQIPGMRQSPLSKYLNSVTPLPTTADNPLATQNYFGVGYNITNQHTETGKVDHRLSDRDNLSFRVSHSPAYNEATNNPYDGSPTTLDKKANGKIEEQQSDSGVANWTHTFSPTFFGETLMSVSRDYLGTLPLVREDIASELGLPNPFKGMGFPRIPYTISSAVGGGMSYDSSTNPIINYTWIYSVDQNFTKLHGRHEFQFGARVRYEDLRNLEDMQVQQGQIDFNIAGNSGLYDRTSSPTAPAATPYTGHVAANFYMGLAAYTSRFNRTFIPLRNSEIAGYFQDNFRVNSRLTLNLGLRYEYNSPVNPTDGSLIGFDRKNKAVVLPQSIEKLASMNVLLPSIAEAYAALGVKYESPQDGGFPAGLVHKNLWDFGPRLGFAYRVGSARRSTVLRGGYAIFAYPESLRLFQGVIYKTIPAMGQISYNPNSGAQSPDGLSNYMLRSVPSIVAGVNSANALGGAQVTGLTRGSGVVYHMDPHQPTARAHQWSLLLERELFGNTVLKTGMVGTHGARIGQFFSYNDAPPAYVWYTNTGVAAPTGEYSAVATRPYDQQVYGTIQEYRKTGISNNTSFQVELEHRYSKGYAFQLFYVMSNAMRMGGDGFRDDIPKDPTSYLPGVVPADDIERSRLLYYRRDVGIKKHRVNWNFLVDLPFGTGKPIGRGAGRAVNALIGGWQVAGIGQLYSRYFQLPTGYIANNTDVEYYGKKYPIQDCRSGVCYDGWLLWNGYIPANRINSYDPKTGNPNGVMGVPDNYRPFATPLWPTPKDGGSPSDPRYGFYDTNTVWIPLKNGTVQRTTLGGYLEPMQNQFMLGPMQWSMSASLFKSVKVNERVTLRINADFLNNVFNMPGTALPSAVADGVITTRSSANAARLLQLSLRVTF